MFKRIIHLGISFFLFVQGAYAQLWKQYKDSADVHYIGKSYDKALPFYLKAIEWLQRDSILTLTYCQVCRNTGICHYYLSNYKESTFFLEEAKKMMVHIAGRENAGYSNICNVLAAAYQSAGKFDTAKSIYIETRELRAVIYGRDTSEAYAQSCNNLGALYREMGEYNQAEQLILEAAGIRKKKKGKSRISAEKYAITSVSLANLYRDMGQYKKAEKSYFEAKNIRAGFDPPNESRDFASSCNILADLYNNYTAEFDKALPLYLIAKSIRKKEKSKWEYAETCSNLGALYRNLGEFKDAESLLLEANEIYLQLLPESIDNLTISYNNLGEYYYMQKEYEKSITYYLKARDQWREKLSSDHPFLIANTDELAKAYWNFNKTGNADKLIQEAVKAKYLRLNKIFQFTNENEKLQYLKNINGSNDEYQSFYFLNNGTLKADIPYEISLLNRNLTLRSTSQVRQNIFNSLDSTLLKEFDNWQHIKQQLARLYTNGQDTSNLAVKELEEKAELLEKKLSRNSADFKSLLQEPADWKIIKQHLSQDEAAIEFIAFHFFNGERYTDSIYYKALILRKDTHEPLSVNLFEEKQLDSLLMNSRDNSVRVNKTYSRGLKVTSNNSAIRSVFNLIWKPMEPLLQGVRKIYFAPSGLLHRIAFAALPVDSMHRLSEKYQLIQLSTTASIPNLQEEILDTNKKIYLVGGVQYGKSPIANKPNKRTLKISGRGGFYYLPGTEKEVYEVAEEAKSSHFTTDILQGYLAKEDSIVALNGFSSPQVLHIATHGFFFPDPGSTKESSFFSSMVCGKNFRQSENPLFRSGLLFAGANRAWCGDISKNSNDGILTAYEVASLYLPNTKLVVLSACETALGDIEGSEGVYGLQRSFKMAGVKNIIMSLWKVPDIATAEFMKVFYQKMFSGETIANAFYETQNTMRIKYRNDSYKWAAWVLVR